MHRLFLSVICCVAPLFIAGQSADPRLLQLQIELEEVRQEENRILSKMEEIKLELLRQDLHAVGLPALRPGEEIVHHLAFSLVYDEEHEQARWVAHIISPDVITGTVDRTNDFRPDPLVATGTAVEADYFLKYLQSDSSYTYDGFGYDRGHLAPSADFRWSRRALSESYYYSNMSPQVAEFNRGKWAELEGFLRDYVERHPDAELLVVTGPILEPGLPRIERGPNQVSIPKLYFKVALDLKHQRGIGFLMPNRALDAPLRSFAVSIDKVEEESGIDFFAALSDEREAQLESYASYPEWAPPDELDEVEPLYPPSLPRNHFNTVQAAQLQNNGREVIVCGTVVSASLSRKGNVFLNLDKKYPNQIFTVTIWKDQLEQFDYAPHESLLGKTICVEGKVVNFNGTPSINVERAEQIREYEKE